MVELMTAPNFPGEHESEEAVQKKNGFDLLPTSGPLLRMAVLGKFFCLQNDWQTGRWALIDRPYQQQSKNSILSLQLLVCQVTL